jgi:hypothetical protein
MTEIQKECVYLLLQKYNPLLTTKEAAEATGRSVQSLQRDRIEKVGMAYKKAKDAENSKVYYPITSIIDYMMRDLVVTK